MAVIRVLLVDDNAIVRRGIASLLGEADGIEVVGEAADGRQAIAVARETKPDVVCLDVRMPVMDGVAAAKPLSESAKVLMLSYSEDELGLGSLTAREREVLNLLARGNTNREIAEQLFITNKTVKNHLSRIYEKIGVHSRAEAIALWLGVGGR